MADRKISDLTALTTPASGDFLPIVDISEAAAATKNKRITIQSLLQGIPVNVGIGIDLASPEELLHLSATTDPKIQFTDVGNVISKIGISASTALTFEHNGSERARIRSDGMFEVKGAGTAGSSPAFSVNGSAPANSAVIDSSGRFGIGTNGPSNQLTIAANAISTITLDWHGDNLPKATFSANHATGEVRMGATNNSGIYFTTLYSNNAERARIRSDGMFEVKGAGVSGSSPAFSVNGSAPANSAVIDTSGRLLVGTSSNSGGATCQVSGSVQASNTFRLPTNTKNAGFCRPIAIETISTDGGANTVDVYGNMRYGAGKWVLLAAFTPAGDAVDATGNVSNGATLVFCITDAATNFPTT